MSVLNKLASAQQRQDDVPNQELARELAHTKNTTEIRELVDNLHNRNAQIQSDCIKTLYELGYLAPELIADYVQEFIGLITSKQNRLVWGGMIALSTIATLKAPEIFQHRATLKKVIANGSVITVDNGIKTLAFVASTNAAYRAEISPYLFQHLRECRPKEVPMHAEFIAVAITPEGAPIFREVLAARTSDLKPPQVKRIEKILKNLP